MVKTTKLCTNSICFGAVFFALIMLFSITSSIAANRSTKMSAVKTAQAERIIKGVVNDEEGYPVIGASVLVLDGNRVVETDLNGFFSLSIPSENEVVLKVSFFGMVSQDIIVTPKMNDLEITLHLDSEQLDELIVTGYQTISKERAAGSAAIISQEKFNKVSSPDISKNLEGLVPGLTVAQDGSMSIRGTSSLVIGSQPLVVIDGMPVENISNEGLSSTGLALVNPSDVESIVVLKDATATSLYGIRATNGVIVVTTKKGTTKKPVVSFSANYYATPNSDIKHLKYASTADIIDYEIEYMHNNPVYQKDPMNYFVDKTWGNTPEYITGVDDLYCQLADGTLTQEEVNKQINMLKGRDYRQEYQDYFAKTSLVQDYNLSVSQGSDFAQTYFSARYQDTNPNSIDEKSNKISLNLNNTFKFFRWFKLNTGLTMNVDNSSNKNLSYIGGNTFMPYDQILDANGERVQRYPYNMYIAKDKIGTDSKLKPMGYNVYDDLESGSFSKGQDIYLKFMTSAEIKVLKGLSLDIRFQYETINGKNEAYYSEDSYYMRELLNKFTQKTDTGYGYYIYDYNIPYGGKLAESDRQLNNLTFRTQANYNTKIGEKHSINALAGFEMRENKIRFTAHDRYGYNDQTLSYQYIDEKMLSQTGVVGALYSTSQRLSTNMGVMDAMHRYVSAYANASYSYSNKYSVTGNVRMDQADLFGTDPKYRYRPLWSVGASWNIDNENFMNNVTAIDMLKFRATYGITGNVDQNSTPFLVGSMSLSPETGYGFTEVTTPPNKLLRWEKTATYNVGVDVAAFQRLSASIDVYKKYSSDLLALKRYDPSMGFDSGYVNNGAMSNKGIEISLSYDWIKNGDWRFNTQITAAHNKSVVEDIDYEPTSALDLLSNPYGYYLEGTPRGTLYAYKYIGLNEVGDPIILDENGDEVSNNAITSLDAVEAVGQLTPKWEGMINLSLSYKNFELFTRFVYYTGHRMRYDAMPLYQGVYSGNIHRDIVDRWTPDNTDTNIPAINKYGIDVNRGDHWKYADIHILNASYLKARNIGLTYTFSQKLLSKIGFKSLVLRAQVDNPFYIAANKEGIDPEAYDLNSGIRYTKIMPTYTFGVNVSF